MHSFGSLVAPLAPSTFAAGALGDLPARLAADGQRRTATLAEVLIHELGHVDAAFYYGGMDTNGDAVRIENQVRTIEMLPWRIGHDFPYDVLLAGALH